MGKPAGWVTSRTGRAGNQTSIVQSASHILHYYRRLIAASSSEGIKALLVRPSVRGTFETVLNALAREENLRSGLC
jgi:hypothetical protein